MKTEQSGGKQKEDGGSQAFSPRQEGRWCWHGSGATACSLAFTLCCGNSVLLQRPKLGNNLSGWVSKHEQIQEQCFWFLWALRWCFPHVRAVTSLWSQAGSPGIAVCPSQKLHQAFAVSIPPPSLSVPSSEPLPRHKLRPDLLNLNGWMCRCKTGCPWSQAASDNCPRACSYLSVVAARLHDLQLMGTAMWMYVRAAWSLFWVMSQGLGGFHI